MRPMLPFTLCNLVGAGTVAAAVLLDDGRLMFLAIIANLAVVTVLVSSTSTVSHGIKGARRFSLAGSLQLFRRSPFVLAANVALVLLVCLPFLVIIVSNPFGTKTMLVVLMPTLITLFFLQLLRPFVFRALYESFLTNIVQRIGDQVAGVQDGYSPRPFSRVLFTPDEAYRFYHYLVRYGEFIAGHLGIMGYLPTAGSVVFYPPTLEFYELLGYRAKSKAHQVTRVTAYWYGTLAVQVSGAEYRRLGREVTYHQLCEALLGAFAESIRAYMYGNPAGAARALAPQDPAAS